MGHSGTKTSYLLKANLKQNRIKHVIWLVLLVGLFAAAAMEFSTCCLGPKKISMRLLKP